MKTKFLLIPFLSLFCAFNFDTAAQSVADVRELYNQVKADIARQNDDIHMVNKWDLTMQHNVPGIGPQTIKFALNLSPYSYSDDGQTLPHKLQLASCSYNVAARKIYEEFLYDADGQLVFAYRTQPLLDDNATKQHVRIYRHKNKLLKLLVTLSARGQTKTLLTTSANEKLTNEHKLLIQKGLDLQQIFNSFQSNLLNDKPLADDAHNPTATPTKKQIEAELLKLPEMKNLALACVSEPSNNEPFYTFHGLEHHDTHTTTVIWFHVYIKPDYQIKVYDIVTDSDLTLEQWRQSY